MVFELVGVILALAIYNNIILDVKLSNIIYKKLLNEPTGIEDVKEIDINIYNALKHILEYKENDIEEKLFLSF